MERIILYYSESGKTKVVAETLALNLRCDICQIKDMKKRDGIRSRLGSTIDAFRESKTEIYPPTLDLEEYGTVYIGTPIWANNPTPAIITLIDSCDLRGKDTLISALFTETTAIFMVFFISLFGTGFLYSAIAELLRSNAEIAFNTSAMLAIKRHEHEIHHNKAEHK